MAVITNPKVTKTKNKSPIRSRRPNKKPVLAKSKQKNSRKKAIKNRIKQNRPVHKRILLNPTVVLILLCAMVFVAGWTYQVVADTMISSKIFAPVLNQGAIITSPASGSVFTTQAPVIVSGTCPSNSYVEIYVNGTFSGVGLCSAAHRFQVQISLFKGSNTVVAEDFNATDQEGPVTPGVAVSLKLPEATASTPQASANSSSVSVPDSTAPPLLLTSSFQWRTFFTHSTFTWQMDLEGGSPPYTVKVDWGDGQTSNYMFTADPVFNISHNYVMPGYYSIKANSVDSNGTQRVMQLAALISSPGKSPNFFAGSTITTAKPNNLDNLSSFFVSSRNWLWLIWPSLLIVGLMIFSFWLGEVQDRRLILARKKPLRHSPLH